MLKGEMVVPVIPVVLVAFAALGLGFFLFQGSGGDDVPETVELVQGSESYRLMAENGDPSFTIYEIDEQALQYSRNNDFPYNFSGVEEPVPTFTTVVDLANFSEEESRLLMVNTTVRAHIYQINSKNETINNISASELAGELYERRNEMERKRMCSSVSINFTSREIEEYEFSLPKVQIANFGNSTYSGDIQMELKLENGQTRTEYKYDLPADAIYNFDFSPLTDLEKVQKATLRPLNCPKQEKTITDFSVQ